MKFLYAGMALAAFATLTACEVDVPDFDKLKAKRDAGIQCQYHSECPKKQFCTPDGFCVPCLKETHCASGETCTTDFRCVPVSALCAQDGGLCGPDGGLPLPP